MEHTGVTESPLRGDLGVKLCCLTGNSAGLVIESASPKSDKLRPAPSMCG